jgi:arylsulfatase A-like enzyme
MASSNPNILFILADDLGYADVSCYGRRDFTTPNIDRIAAEGVRFTQAYANSAVCTASRVAMMTGRYQYRLAVGLEEPLSTRMPRKVGLPPDHPTLPSILKNAGYRTALIGKWHLGALPEFGPLQSGYEYFYGFRNGAVDYFTHKSGPATTGAEDLWEGDVRIRQAGYLTDLLGSRAVDVVQSYAAAGQPFFISLHFSAPHWPWEAPGDEAEAQRLQNLFHYDGGTQRTYRRMIVQMDLQIGRALQALDATGSAQNTMVIFTSDNGGERFSDTWPFTGRKTELLEGGLRVPAIIRWPDQIPCGIVSEQVTIGMDWFPTLLSAAGAAPDPAYPSDGIDLLPGLTQRLAALPRKLFWRYKYNDQQAAREGDWKYLKILDNTFLFDVAQDPMERANLKERRREVYDGLIAEWNQWNATMLRLDPESFTGGFTGAQLADHFGVKAR